MLRFLRATLFINVIIAVGLLSACTTHITYSSPTKDLSPLIPTQTLRIESQPSQAFTSFITSTEIPTNPILVTSLPTSTLQPVPSITPTFDNNSWVDFPVIPTVSQNVKDIFTRGQALGDNPHAFSKIGDCETAAQWFLGDFDMKPDHYSLGKYTDLNAVIQQFSGSFIRSSLASRIGFNAASVLNPIWADLNQCQANETPLACEYRVERPAFAFILLGTNDVYHQASFESNLRQIIEYSIQQGVIPILATKASNLEGNHAINIIIARLAYEYDIPLWNFWLAVQPLPNGGLQADNEHLTWNPNFFDNPLNMKAGWTIRNLTALQVLSAVWQGVITP
jgi:hypothetical protein